MLSALQTGNFVPGVHRTSRPEVADLGMREERETVQKTLKADLPFKKGLVLVGILDAPSITVPWQYETVG